jgi:hypothetical protein
MGEFAAQNVLHSAHCGIARPWDPLGSVTVQESLTPYLATERWHLPNERVASTIRIGASKSRCARSLFRTAPGFVRRGHHAFRRSHVAVRPGPVTIAPPPIPICLPATLLERRLDIASIERTVLAVNEQISIGRSNFFPDASLPAAAGL